MEGGRGERRTSTASQVHVARGQCCAAVFFDVVLIGIFTEVEEIEPEVVAIILLSLTHRSLLSLAHRLLLSLTHRSSP